MISINDLKRAILNGGDVSHFASIYYQALGGSPIPIVSQFDSVLELPSPAVLIEQADARLADPLRLQPQESTRGEPPVTELDVSLVALSPYDIMASQDLTRTIIDSHPDIIGLDCSPAELGAHIPYAFSLACAVGLPAQFEIIHGNSVEARFNGSFHPGNAGVSALIESWLRRIPMLPLGRPLSTGRQTPIEEARYVASRIADVVRYSSILGRRVRLLAMVDPERYAGVQHVTASFRQNINDDLYIPPEVDIEPSQSFIVGTCLDNPDESRKETPDGSTVAQARFRAEFERSVCAMDTKPLSPTEATNFVTPIVRRTRNHPKILRGASVRGTIAFDEILDSLSNLKGGLTRECIGKAALITLPPRISVRQRGNEEALVSDIVKEVLYGIRLSHNDEETIHTTPEHLPADSMEHRLDDTEQGQRRQETEPAGTESFAVVPETPGDMKNLNRPREPDFSKSIGHNQYSMVKQAVMSLIRALDDQLQAGKITAEEYERQKAGLMTRLEKAARAQLRISDGEQASTIIEMMDAQDGQWNSEVSLNRMRVYYHIKGTCEGMNLNPLKQDYHALKWLIDDLREQRIVRPTGEASGFLLTGLALDVLLKHLMNRDAAHDHSPSMSGLGTAFTSDRGHEVRRYSHGDTSRDLSIRHTLREVARRKKSLAHITSTDLRVFLKERRKPQADIVFCIDISGSMGFHHKLTYARLVAAGLVEAAFHDGNRAGVVAFNDNGQTTVPLTGTDKDSLFDGIARLTPRGNTNIGDGVRSSRELLLQHHNRNRKHIVLISDGQASAVSAEAFAQLKSANGRDLTEESALYETNRAAAAGVQVSVVYIATGDEADDIFIKTVAKAGKGTIHRLNGLADIKTMLRR